MSRLDGTRGADLDPTRPHDAGVVTPVVVAVDHISLRVADYYSTQAWYSSAFGLPVVREWLENSPNGPRQLGRLRLGQTELELIGGGSPTPRPTVASIEDSLGHSGLAHLCLTVASLDDTVALLSARGVEPFAGPIELPVLGLRLVLILDNAGNVLEIAERQEVSTS